MKKYFILLSVVTMLSFSGCIGSDMLSELFQSAEKVNEEENSSLDENMSEIIESEEVSEDTDSNIVVEIAQEESIDEDESVLTEDNVDNEFFILELKATDNPKINELLNISGTYTDSVGNVDDYLYQIPQFNADSESAKVVNERIVEDIYDNIYEEFVSMSGGYSLFCYNINYETVEYGDIVTIIISAPYPNDWVVYYAYSYDFAQDKELSNEEMLAMHDWTEEAFIEEACRREKEYFKRQISSIYPDMTEEEIDCYIQSAVDETTVDLPMYIGTDGVLYVYLPMPSVAGADWYYGLETF